MNRKIFFITAVAMFLSSTSIIAQGWKIGGNSLTTSGKFGSTTNQDIQFISNNTVNGVLTKTGLWGFGITAPAAKLHINSAFGQDVLRMQVNGSTKLLLSANGGLAVGASATPPVNGLFVQGNAGIGTNTPISKLHIVVGASGTVPFANSALALENSTNNYISVLAPNSNESGILFGNPSNNVSGGIIYNSSFQGSAPNALQFRTNGNVPRMTLTANGNLGIGTTTPNARLDLGDLGTVGGLMVRSGDSRAIDLVTNSGSATISAVNNNLGPAVIATSEEGDGIIAITHDPISFAGFFAGDVITTGTYQSSDERLKQNIRDFSSAMNIINELHPKRYQFKKDGNYGLMQLPKGDHYGLIAQDVEKVLPNLVKNANFDTRLTKTDADRQASSPSDVINFKALNYTELIPIIIKAMQEFSVQNDDLKKQNEAQQKQIDELKSIVMKNNQSTSSQTTINATLADAALEQNTPNPFSNATSVRYNLPQKFTAAKIIITDANGRTIKQLNITGAGKGAVNIDASMLTPGTYQYSLIVDGKIICSKQMILTR